MYFLLNRYYWEPNCCIQHNLHCILSYLVWQVRELCKKGEQYIILSLISWNLIPRQSEVSWEESLRESFKSFSPALLTKEKVISNRWITTGEKISRKCLSFQLNFEKGSFFSFVLWNIRRCLFWELIKNEVHILYGRGNAKATSHTSTVLYRHLGLKI